MHTNLREFGDLGLQEDDAANKAVKETINTMNTINTIATGSEAVSDNKNGFFSENLKSIMKSKRSIEKAIDKISSQLLVYN